MWKSVNATKAIGKELWQVLTVDPDFEGFNGLGFLRARIEIDVVEALPRKLTVMLGQSSRLVSFKFKGLPNYCYDCGMLEHTEDYCSKPPLYDEERNLERWGEDLRGFPPRRARRGPPAPLVRQPAYPRQQPTFNDPPLVRLYEVAHSVRTGREPFKRKKASPATTPSTTPRSSHDMEGLEVEVADAGSKPVA